MLMITNKNFNQYMENTNNAYILLAEHVESLERRLLKIDNLSFEKESEEYKKENEKLEIQNEEKIDS